MTMTEFTPYSGLIGGGLIGGLLGSQIGGGHGRTAAEIAGALGDCDG